MNRTKIEWCDVTLNPVVGCTYGCEYCYARKMNQRFGWIKDFSKPQFFPERLKKLDSKKPQVVFMNSLSDIADWEDPWIYQTFVAMKRNPQHRYLFLTKRFDDFAEKVMASSALAQEVVRRSKSIMIGLTVDAQSILENTNTVPDFFSIEPILESIDLDTCVFDDGFEQWVIIGAETGNRKGKVIPKKEWIDSIVRQCNSFGAPVFMKDSLVPIVGEEGMLRELPW